jgi:DDE superfamily endonuclease
VVHRGQESACPPSPQSAFLRSKKNSASILSSIQQLWRECFPAFDQQRVADRAQALSLSSLLCLGRHTLTGLLTTTGQEFQDWSANYRLFSHHRLPLPQIFSVIRRHVLAQLPPQAPLCVAIDDSLLRKTGIRIPGVAWRRDPLGPHFQNNFVRAQRVLQFSADLPLPDGNHRMIPISFTHAPTPLKPSPKASEQQRAQYRQASRLARLPLLASQQIASLRQALDAEPDGVARRLLLFVDGGYTNATVLKKLPAHTSLVGRIRKDAKLYLLPDDPQPNKGRGRPRHYGETAPTPEQLRTDDAVPWQNIPISIAGVPHTMRVKLRQNLLWRTAGLLHTLQLVVIAPLGYRLRKGSRLLYRQPAFLICTDPQLDLLSLLQGYVQRWDIEVNFREEKTLLGVGQAQVRHSESVESVPALQVASYAMLLLATIGIHNQASACDLLPRPKWAASPTTPRRLSTQTAINQLRAETWGRALGLMNFSDFVSCTPSASSPEKFLPHLPSAVCYATT